MNSPAIQLGLMGEQLCRSAEQARLDQISAERMPRADALTALLSGRCADHAVDFLEFDQIQGLLLLNEQIRQDPRGDHHSLRCGDLPSVLTARMGETHLPLGAMAAKQAVKKFNYLGLAHAHGDRGPIGTAAIAARCIPTHSSIDADATLTIDDASSVSQFRISHVALDAPRSTGASAGSTREVPD
jgi:hypothetical protein